MLFCAAVIALVGIFGYSRYKASQAEYAAFRAQLQGQGVQSPGPLAVHMPPALPGGGSLEKIEPAASPQSGQ